MFVAINSAALSARTDRLLPASSAASVTVISALPRIRFVAMIPETATPPPPSESAAGSAGGVSSFLGSATFTVPATVASIRDASRAASANAPSALKSAPVIVTSAPPRTSLRDTNPPTPALPPEAASTVSPAVIVDASEDVTERSPPEESRVVAPVTATRLRDWIMFEAIKNPTAAEAADAAPAASVAVTPCAFDDDRDSAPPASSVLPVTVIVAAAGVASPSSVPNSASRAANKIFCGA